MYLSLKISKHLLDLCAETSDGAEDSVGVGERKGARGRDGGGARGDTALEVVHRSEKGESLEEGTGECDDVPVNGGELATDGRDGRFNIRNAAPGRDRRREPEEGEKGDLGELHRCDVG